MGGFHLLMACLGIAGYVMESSGLSDTLETVHMGQMHLNNDVR